LLLSAGPVGYLADVAFVLAVVAILSSITYWLVERPAMRLKHRTDRRHERPRKAAGPVPAYP
jgi:peptidoglycan/LPS O-acetylase OafA/YrhL